VSSAPQGPARRTLATSIRAVHLAEATT
jgi:hypothetical protein